MKSVFKMITEAQVLLMAHNFDECKIEDRGFSFGILIKGRSRCTYGVALTIDKNELHTLQSRITKANNSVLFLDKVSIAA